MNRSTRRDAASTSPVVVVGSLETTTVLSGVRALAAAGRQVHVVGGGDDTVLRRSRRVARVHRTPPPASDADAFVARVRQVVSALRDPVVLTAGDAELVVLAAARDQALASAGVPDPDTVDAVLNKSQLPERARAAGLQSPGVPAAGVLPAVVKSAVHYQPGRGEPRWEARVVTTDEELQTARREAQLAGVDVVTQQWVDGRLMALSLVIDAEGESVGRCQQETSQTWPAGAGRSALAVTVPVDDALAGAATRLLRAAGWVGLAQLQFLATGSGPPLLIDVNPRLYGSVSLAVAAGCPLPDLAVRVLRGERVTPVRDARPGVRYRWLEGQLRGAATGAARVRAVSSALHPYRRTVGPVWDVHDPLPAGWAVLDLARRATRLRGR